jgi:hypothetical protein
MDFRNLPTQYSRLMYVSNPLEAYDSQAGKAMSRQGFVLERHPKLPNVGGKSPYVWVTPDVQLELLRYRQARSEVATRHFNAMFGQMLSDG